MKKVTILLFCCLSALFAFANDGVFYAAGNQLIPITETDISVKKEVLTLNRVGNHIEGSYGFFSETSPYPQLQSDYEWRVPLFRDCPCGKRPL